MSIINFNPIKTRNEIILCNIGVKIRFGLQIQNDLRKSDEYTFILLSFSQFEVYQKNISKNSFEKKK